MRVLLFFTILLSSFQGFTQNYHYPTANNWETKSPEDLNYCSEQIDSLYDFLDQTNTKAFIILHEGKIVLEKYFGTFTVDSSWYWASAGKSLMAVLLAKAQGDGDLNIEDPTSDYLGKGWTSTTPEQETAITIKHQMAMATGLDDNQKPTLEHPDPLNCLDPECLKYEVAPGEQWAYHNAPYRLTQDVLEEATGRNKTIYTLLALKDLNFTGAWLNYIYFSKPRTAAKFGLLMLSDGKWAGKTVIQDTALLHEMVRPSQDINPSYGLLWWLNGQKSHRLPRIDITQNGWLVPNAPKDMYGAMGKNDQRIYVVPSQDLVVVRMGHSGGESAWAVSAFDNKLWHRINQLTCESSGLVEKDISEPSFYWHGQNLNASNLEVGDMVTVMDVSGKVVHRQSAVVQNVSIPLHQLPRGIYVVKCSSAKRRYSQKLWR